MGKQSKRHLMFAVIGVSLSGGLPASANDHPEPLTLPIPTYPSEAAVAGLSGFCETQFDIDQSGNVITPRAKCTDKVFCEEVIRAISDVSFAPKIENGKPVPHYGVTYPFAFSISGQQADPEKEPLKACDSEEKAVS